VKRICRYLPPLSLLLLSIPFASAQSSVDFNVGFGTAHDKAAPGGIDSNTGSTCTLGAANCQATPALSGFFMGVGGDVMLTKRYGFGGEASFQPAKTDYGPLQYREIFYDFNGIFAPVNQKKAIVKIEGGIGGAKSSFSYTQTSCVGTAVCSKSTQPVGASNHFQVHAGLGVQIFLTEHVFIRPQFDFHYVPGLTDQFGSNMVPAAMVWLGYSMGDR
jgi:Outer membrane protein beta-barrel domain